MNTNHYWYNEDEFIDEMDKQIFEEYLNDPSTVLMEMANMVGNRVKTDANLPFSFYFSTKSAVHGAHGIRVKILWNPSKSPNDADGYMELHGNYEYVRGSHKYKPTEKELKVARNFFKKYKVIFSAVWEEKMDYTSVQDFFEGEISFRELLINFTNVTEKQFYLINHASTLEELESIVREKKIFNMND